MEIRHQQDGNKLTIAIEGVIDALTARDLDAFLAEHLENADEVVFDLSKLEYTSSAGLRSFLATQQHMDAKDGDMTITGPNQFVREIFSETGFDMLFNIENSSPFEAVGDEYLLERVLKEKDPDLHTRMRESVFVLKKMLGSFLNRFPDFTDHSLLHSMNVLNYCNLVIGKDQIDRLYPEEIYALIMACYLHDIGMGISENDFRELAPAIDFGDREVDFEAGGDPNTVRKFHNELSGVLIRKYAQIFDFPSEELTFAVIQISRGHRSVDLYDTEQFPVIKTGESEIRTAYLAAVLRVADEMDVGSDRNPEYLFDTSELTNIKDIEAFGVHESIKLVEVKGDEIWLYVEPKSPEFVPLIEETAAELRRKVDYCRDVAEKFSDLTILPKTVVLKPWEES